MAKFTLAGFEEAERQIMMQGEKVKLIPVMLEAGAEVLVRAQRQEAQRLNRSGRSRGGLVNSIKVDRTVYGRDGGIYKEVYPQGIDRNHTKKGVRNAEKGFVQEYGRSNMPANPWMSTANEKCESEVNSTMLKIWEDANK